jgi:tRNA-dihydrouridine synthase C
MNPPQGKLLLAPMEGLADYVLRDLLTRVGGYHGAVSEFIRVSGTLLPPRAFRRICPELANASRTRAGTPVAVQLLGSDPACLAENAAQLAELSPAGIDLNFGCPAPGVNRHGGGAVLLDDPERLYRIAQAVRRAVPATIPFSAKMRLGVSDTAKALDCARALEAGGVLSLVVHARTRAERYQPPAHWEWVARIRDAVRLPVAANGEVWTADDYARCRSVSGSDDVMIGRGAVADPFLARRIAARAGGALPDRDRAADWLELLPLLADFWGQVLLKVEPLHAPGRLKLWLAALRRTFVEAEALHAAVRTRRGVEETTQVLALHGVPVASAPRARRCLIDPDAR